MKEKILITIRKINESKLFKTAVEHVIKPLFATTLLAAFFFMVIYNRGDNTAITDSFFVYYVFLFPFVINSAISFLRLNKRKVYGTYGFSLAAVPFIAVLFYRSASMYSRLPDFYRDFNESGSFFLIYAMYAVFFIIGGVFTGLIDEFITDESRAVLKYPDAGQLSKSKRRKIKKKKKDVIKGGAPVRHEIIDEIIGVSDSKNSENGGVETGLNEIDDDDSEKNEEYFGEIVEEDNENVDYEDKTAGRR